MAFALIAVLSTCELFASLPYGERGAYGLEHTDLAVPLPALTLTVAFQAAYFQATNFLVPGDEQRQYNHQLVVTFAPLELLELSVAARVVVAANPGPVSAPFAANAVASVGDPTFGIKASHVFAGIVGVGALVNAQLPTSAGGSGLRPDALRLTMLAALSVLPRAWLHATLNVGYLLDNSSRLFGQPLAPFLNFAAGISRTGLALVALGVGGEINIAGLVGLGPFAEFSSGFGSVPLAQDPIKATLGLKLYPLPRPFELALGSDIRIAGAPVPGGKLPGLAPWEAFVRLTVALLPLKSAAPIETREVVVKEVKEVAPASFTIEGTILAADTKKPIAGSQVAISGSDTSALAVDRAGNFKSYAVPSGEGLIQITASAPGYLKGEETLARLGNGQVYHANLLLQRADKTATGELKGSLKDARTGAPIVGQVFIPALDKKIGLDAAGKFQAKLPVGTLQVLVSARGYVTQKKEVEISAGDVVILNVDLAHEK